jgi:hypothetical protein
MSETGLSATELPLFHPAAHYNSPADMLADAELSEPEKRIILSSYGRLSVCGESCPALRDIPGMDRTW